MHLSKTFVIDRYHSTVCRIEDHELGNVWLDVNASGAFNPLTRDFIDFIKNEGLGLNQYPNAWIGCWDGGIGGFNYVTFYNQDIAVRFKLQFS